MQGSSNLRPGFELGAADKDGTFVIFNHLAFNVLIHRTHGEFTRAQNHSPYTSGLVMDAATRKLLRSKNIAEDSLVTERDEASGRLLAWPEGTPNEVVSALHGMSGRSLAANDDEAKEKAAEKKKQQKEERAKEKEEQAKEKEEEIAAVRPLSLPFLPVPCDLLVSCFSSSGLLKLHVCMHAYLFCAAPHNRHHACPAESCRIGEKPCSIPWDR